ncbi:hypothetical protein GCM10018785_37640 [Streptomyces longispororuber]|uniref:Uncharacterized protein n=1 Tax=Streptomyces longispororuber TaxID=68230 RepID=A0A919DQ22_9ACTN|nr:hypothetical protein [Streptomyces longispororuber]GHE65263.1 hypothetical protein GCM10018785_37640 [Streptomyces longispororuber]
MVTRKKLAKPPTVDPHAAMEALREALWAANRIVLPSLSMDYASPHLGLVVLGSARADVVAKIAEELAKGRRLADEVAALKRELDRRRIGES